ncbi:hypothetical protein EVAR_101589_1 [Eumeta japonica]|uniref:Uncharacterized protein n=1 Tax=Eumeta variegata TaxID=151549 RepID=A0A4C1SNI5_EUMVA|nr:hypothetical protein EVAR_101589_1 [Eumeta japonica]
MHKDASSQRKTSDQWTRSILDAIEVGADVKVTAKPNALQYADNKDPDTRCGIKGSASKDKTKNKKLFLAINVQNCVLLGLNAKRLRLPHTETHPVVLIPTNRPLYAGKSRNV